MKKIFGLLLVVTLGLALTSQAQVLPGKVLVNNTIKVAANTTTNLVSNNLIIETTKAGYLLLSLSGAAYGTATNSLTADFIYSPDKVIWMTDGTNALQLSFTVVQTNSVGGISIITAVLPGYYKLADLVNTGGGRASNIVVSAIPANLPK